MSYGLWLPLRPAKDMAGQVQAQGVQPRGYGRIYVSVSLSKVRIIDHSRSTYVILGLGVTKMNELLPTLKDPTDQPYGSHPRHTASAT